MTTSTIKVMNPGILNALADATLDVEATEKALEDVQSQEAGVVAVFKAAFLKLELSTVNLRYEQARRRAHSVGVVSGVEYPARLRFGGSCRVVLDGPDTLLLLDQ